MTINDTLTDMATYDRKRRFRGLLALFGIGLMVLGGMAIDGDINRSNAKLAHHHAPVSVLPCVVSK